MRERCMCGDPECSVCGPLQGFPKTSLVELNIQRREEEADLEEDLDDLEDDDEDLDDEDFDEDDFE